MTVDEVLASPVSLEKVVEEEEDGEEEGQETEAANESEDKKEEKEAEMKMMEMAAKEGKNVQITYNKDGTKNVVMTDNE